MSHTAIHFVMCVLAAYFFLAWSLTAYRWCRWASRGDVRLLYKEPGVRAWQLVASICLIGAAVYA